MLKINPIYVYIIINQLVGVYIRPILKKKLRMPAKNNPRIARNPKGSGTGARKVLIKTGRPIKKPKTNRLNFSVAKE